MKVLALEKDRVGADPAASAPHLHAEARAVWELTQRGIIREIYFRETRSAAVIVLEVDSAQHAREALDQLPLVRAGLIEFEVIGLRPYPGFSRLMGG